MSYHHPEHGYEPWLNDETRPNDGEIDLAIDAHMLMANENAKPESLSPDHQNVMAKMGWKYSGADAIKSEIKNLPSGRIMYASYIDNYTGYDQLVSRFGDHFNGLLLSITIYGGKARCADVEQYAMTAPQLPHWHDSIALKTAESPAWVYCSTSDRAKCNAYMGSRHHIKWSAHYGFGPHVCGPSTCGWPQADWTQWGDVGNYDQSVGNFIPSAAPTPAPQPAPEPPKPVVHNAEGVYRALLEYDAKKNTLSITPRAGLGIKAGNIPHRVHWEIGLEIGSQHFGKWDGKRLPDQKA